MDGAPLDDGKAATSVEERKLTANLDVSSKTVPSSDQQVKISSGDPTANQPRDCFSKGNTNASSNPTLFILHAGTPTRREAGAIWEG